jgi:hypothetical protein
MDAILLQLNLETLQARISELEGDFLPESAIFRTVCEEFGIDDVAAWKMLGEHNPYMLLGYIESLQGV